MSIVNQVIFKAGRSEFISSGPRSRKMRNQEKPVVEEKRPRTAFNTEQLTRLKVKFLLSSEVQLIIFC